MNDPIFRIRTDIAKVHHCRYFYSSPPLLHLLAAQFLSLLPTLHSPPKLRRKTPISCRDGEKSYQIVPRPSCRLITLHLACWSSPTSFYLIRPLAPRTNRFLRRTTKFSAKQTPLIAPWMGQRSLSCVKRTIAAPLTLKPPRSFTVQR